MTFNRNTQNEVRAKCVKMLKNFNKIGKDLTVLMQVKIMFMSKYNKVKMIYVKARDIIAKFINSDLKKDAINMFLDALITKGEPIMNEIWEMFDELDGEFRMQEPWKFSFPYPKNCTEEKCDMLHDWYGPNGMDFNRSIELKDFKPYNTSLINFGSFGDDMGPSDLVGDESDFFDQFVIDMKRDVCNMMVDDNCNIDDIDFSKINHRNYVDPWNPLNPVNPFPDLMPSDLIPNMPVAPVNRILTRASNLAKRILQTTNGVSVLYSETAVDDSNSPSTWDIASTDSSNNVVDDSLLEVDDFVDTAFDADELNQNNLMIATIDETVDNGPVGESVLLGCTGTAIECEQQVENEQSNSGSTTSEEKSTWYWWVIGVVGVILLIATCHYCR